ncbi:MAG: histidine phosphatase family protein [Gaiellaceae bacterium]
MLLLRHASAGERARSASLDRARRLDWVGRSDARLLPEVLSSYAIERIVASPHARCVESVRALALDRGLEVELSEDLGPDAPLAATRALVAELPDAALVCTHREVIERLFDGLTCAKGGAWLLAARDGAWAPTAYLPPPASAIPAADRAAVSG